MNIRQFKIIILNILIILIFFSCTKTPEINNQEKTEESAIAKINIDLSTPPPESNATIEKWETFTDEKRQESWDKYIAENATSTPEVSEEVKEAEEVIKTPGSGGGGGASTIAVTVGSLTKTTLNLYYYGLGELKAGEEIKISPNNGTISSLYVSVGDFVEVGDLLFSLDNSDLVKTIERASKKWDNDLELALIKLNESEENYNTSDSLYKKELISKSEYDKSKQIWLESELNYNKIQLAKTTELENLQVNLNTSLAISPSRGYISEITFNKNELVNSSDFVEIIDIEKIEIVIQVPENIITRIKIGQPVIAKQASSTDYMLNGTISSIGLKSNVNRTFEVTALFDNPNQKLLPGMLMEAEIKLNQTGSNFIVPKASIINNGTNKLIYRIKDNKAEGVPVELGKSREEFVQINGSLNNGDMIVLEGQSYLQQSSSVKVIETRDYLPLKTEL